MSKVQTCKGCGKEFEHRYVSDYCSPCMNPQTARVVYRQPEPAAN